MIMISEQNPVLVIDNEKYLICLLKVCFFSSYLDCNSVQTLQGDCCEFPFVYGGDTYYECTTDGWDRPWCSLTSSYDQDKKDGDCGSRMRAFVNLF